MPFTQQGLEKFNDNMTKVYFRATNHKDERALVQVLEKVNRIEHLRDNDAQAPLHHEVKCGKCGSVGHNKRTCYATVHDKDSSESTTHAHEHSQTSDLTTHSDADS